VEGVVIEVEVVRGVEEEVENLLVVLGRTKEEKLVLVVVGRGGVEVEDVRGVETLVELVVELITSGVLEAVSDQLHSRIWRRK